MEELNDAIQQGSTATDIQQIPHAIVSSTMTTVTGNGTNVTRVDDSEIIDDFGTDPKWTTLEKASYECNDDIYDENSSGETAQQHQHEDQMHQPEEQMQQQIQPTEHLVTENESQDTQTLTNVVDLNSAILSHSTVDAQMEKVIDNIVELGGCQQFVQQNSLIDKDKEVEDIQREIVGDRSTQISVHNTQTEHNIIDQLNDHQLDKAGSVSIPADIVDKPALLDNLPQQLPDLKLSQDISVPDDASLSTALKVEDLEEHVQPRSQAEKNELSPKPDEASLEEEPPKIEAHRASPIPETVEESEPPVLEKVEESTVSEEIVQDEMTSQNEELEENEENNKNNENDEANEDEKNTKLEHEPSVQSPPQIDSMPVLEEKPLDTTEASDVEMQLSNTDVEQVELAEENTQTEESEENLELEQTPTVESPSHSEASPEDEEDEPSETTPAAAAQDETESQSETEQTPQAEVSLNTSNSKMYPCDKCDYAADRINNIVLHKKSLCPYIKGLYNSQVKEFKKSLYSPRGKKRRTLR